MTYQAHVIDYTEAEALVRERLGATDPARSPVRQAIREERLQVYSRGHLLENDGEEIAIALREGSLHGVTLLLSEVDGIWPDPAAPRGGPTHKARLGRTAKYDWEGALLELFRLDQDPRQAEGAADKTQADLVRHLQDWFTDKTGCAPDEKDIKARVRRFQETMRSAE